jgi:hypothetical protein
MDYSPDPGREHQNPPNDTPKPPANSPTPPGEEPTREERAVMRERFLGESSRGALAFEAKAVRHVGPAGGIFARQLLFWDGKGRDPEGWIYKSIGEWQEETGLSRRQQESARNVLTKKRLMEEKRAVGPDGRWRLFFRLDLREWMDLLAPDLEGPEEDPSTLNHRSRVLTNTEQGPCSVLPDRDYAQYSEPTNTENTQEISSPPEGEHRSQPGEIEEEKAATATRLNAIVYRRATKRGTAVDDSQMRQLGQNWKRLLEQDITGEDLTAAAQLVGEDWPRLQSPAKALARVRGETGDGNAKSSPPKVIADLEGHEDLGPWAHIAYEIDLTKCDKDVDAPWRVMRKISKDRIEQCRIWPRLVSRAHRVMRGGGDPELPEIEERPKRELSPEEQKEQDAFVEHFMARLQKKGEG